MASENTDLRALIDAYRAEVEALRAEVRAHTATVDAYRAESEARRERLEDDAAQTAAKIIKLTQSWVNRNRAQN